MPPELLQEYLRAAAERRPEATAVALGEEALTYAELEETSTRLARLLRDAGCKGHDRVCVLIPKSPLAVLAMHAVMKADCVYVPVDVDSPSARIAAMVAVADPALILTTESLSGLIDEARPNMPVGSLGGAFEGQNVRSQFALADATAHSAEPLATRNRSVDPSHILFTSGSTGLPKGVVVTHGSVVHFVEWARRHFGLESTDRLSGHSPLHFDLSSFDVYGAFSAAAELQLVPPELNLLGTTLAAFIREQRLTQWFSVPAAMTQIANHDALAHGAFPEFERVIWCGDVLPTRTLMYWMDRLPHTTFTNLYGPTEATIASSHYTVPRRPQSPSEPIPIGEACPGEALLVLDRELRPVPVDTVGDLYIKGAGLSPGYWRDEAATRAAFVPASESPDGDRLYRTGDLARVSPHGLVYFVGRNDSQIKSRGHRIELGEIEAALDGLGILSEFAVVGVATDGFEGTAICCAYVPRNGAQVDPPLVKRELRARVPSYMLPSRWRQLDALPKNQNGKIDRPRLRELFAETRRA